MIFVTVVSNLVIAMLLLKKATSESISIDDAKNTWQQVDTEDAGVLSIEKTGLVLSMTGVFLSNEELYSMCVRKRAFGPLTGNKEVHIKGFLLHASRDAPSAKLEIAIFFIQTYGLLAKDASIFAFTALLNMDVESTAGGCLAPLGYSGHFLLVLMTPVLLAVSVVICIPAWNWLLACVPDKYRFKYLKGNAQKIEKTHLQRAALHVFMFCFAPLTRASVQALVCRDTCAGGSEDCRPILVFDYAVSCYDADHYVVMMFAVIALLVCVVIVPSFLFVHVRREILRRDAKLGMRGGLGMQQWFEKVDVDRSGGIEITEMGLLLQRMGRKVSQAAMKDMLAKLDKNGDGIVTHAEFEQWYHHELHMVVSAPLDTLYATNRRSSYWWFLQNLLLKFSINVLFTFGYFGVAIVAQWQLAMHALLAATVCVQVVRDPYVTSTDRSVSTLAMLSLAALTHITSRFKPGEEWPAWALAVLVFFFLMPMVFMVETAVLQWKRAKSHRKDISQTLALSPRTQEALTIEDVSDEDEVEALQHDTRAAREVMQSLRSSASVQRIGTGAGHTF
jgi:hypothetical protein